MAPKKVAMEYIANDATRRSTCKKRAMGVIKKASELSTLCGVEACLVIFPEGDGEPSSQMQVWPSLREATATVDRFRSMPEVDRRRKRMDGEDYVRERVGTVKEQLRKAERDNRQRETTLLLHDAMVGRRPSLGGLTVEQLVGMGWATENLVKKIRDCIACHGGEQQAGVEGDPLPPTVAGVEAPHLQRGWVMEVLKAGWDIDAAACSGSGSYGSVGGAGGDVMQLGNMDAGFSWTYPARSTYFPPVNPSQAHLPEH